MAKKTKLQKINFLIVLIISILFLSACSGSGSPQSKDVSYYVGSDGLTLDFLEKDSINEVYEDSTFSYSMVIENKGAHSIVEDQNAILTIGYDPYYIELSTNLSKDQKAIERKGSVSFNDIQLVGRSKYYPSGSNLFFYFPYLKTKNIDGQRAKPETQLFSSICYPYSTYLTELVCVDFDIYGENSRTQVCKQKDITLSNQGAPIAITLIEVENQPMRGNLVRPVYTIHFSNVGLGTVLSPVDTSKELEAVCTSEGLDRSDFNTINIEAWFSTNTKLSCTPEKIRLNDEEGIARCTIPDEELEKALLASRQNYQVPITIKLDYVYLSTLYKTIEIKRLNSYGGALNKTEECFPFEVKGKDGKCQEKCDYCTANPSDSICSQTGSKTTIDWDVGFGCGCSKNSCDTLSVKGLCVPSSTFCAPGSYCCGQACTGTQKKHDDGKCYPLCSTCSQNKVNCLCGSNEDFELIKPLAGYCSSQKNVHLSEGECEEDDGKTDEPVVSLK